MCIYIHTYTYIHSYAYVYIYIYTYTAAPQPAGQPPQPAAPPELAGQLGGEELPPDLLQWHYLSKATCLMRPHSFLRHYLSNTAG